MYTREFETAQSRQAKTRPNDRAYAWLEIGYDNQTFENELEFDPAELDKVYEDSEKEDA